MFLDNDDFLNMYNAIDNWIGTSILDIDELSDFIQVDISTDGLPTMGWLKIENELVFYNSIDGNIISGMERTDGEIHYAGSKVYQPYNADVINTLVDIVKFKDTLRSDLYIPGPDVSEGYKDIFDFMDNFLAVDGFSTTITSYISASGEELYIDSGIENLPDRGWLFLNGESLFFNNKDTEKLYNLYREDGIEHFKNTPVEQLIRAEDWNMVQTTVSNIVFGNYKFGTDAIDEFFYYIINFDSQDEFEMSFYIDIPELTINFPNSGYIPIIRFGDLDILIHENGSDTSILEIKNGSTLSGSVNINNAEVHKIKVELNSLTVAVYYNDTQIGNSISVSFNIDEITFGKCQNEGADLQAANLKFYDIQGSINNGIPEYGKYGRIEKMINLSHIGGYITQSDPSLRGKIFLY